MSDIEVFHFDKDSTNFESYGRQNGFRYWLASDLADCLDYSTIGPVLNAVNKALAAFSQSVCGFLGMGRSSHFPRQSTSGTDG